MTEPDAKSGDAERRQSFRAPELKGEAAAQSITIPVEFVFQWDDEIATRLSLHRSSVTKSRNSMGLPPRWGKKNGFPFTAQHDADLRELKQTTRLSWAQIAFLLDNMPVPHVYARYQLLLTNDASHCDGLRPETVRCMQCHMLFVTPNRRQIHCCDACHKRIELLGSSMED